MRLSLRYLLAKSNKHSGKAGIDLVNESIKGDLHPIRTREDIDEKGKAKITGNIINHQDDA